MRKKTKKTISISIDRQLSDLIKENITNKSKYIEWLIYQDMSKQNISGIEKIIV
jgi:hypothetical protein